MRVLMITGDKKMRPGHPRFDLQATQVEKLEVLHWGRGSLWPALPSGSFDVVTVQDPFWRGLFAWRAARLLRARLNVQVHADVAAQSMVKRELAKIVLRHAGSIRVVSKKLKQQVENMKVRAPITILPIFIDVQRFQNIVPQQHAQKTILWMGRFEKEKDPSRAVDVFQEVRRAGIDAKLIMLGEGSEEPTLREQSKDLPVEFPGWQDPLPYLAQADVVLCTSRHESWGASLVEAMVAGVAVVAPDVGIAKEAGAIVVPREGLVQAVIDVMRSPSRGALKLPLLTKQEWAKQWEESLK